MACLAEFAEFDKWVIQIGVTVDSRPEGDAIKRLMKSKQSDLLRNLTQKICSSRLAIVIRQNKLVSKVHQQGQFPEMVPTESRDYDIIIERARRFDLMWKRTLQRGYEIKDWKNKSNKLISSIRHFNIEKDKFSYQLQAFKLVGDALEAKICLLRKSLQRGNVNKTGIISMIPQKTKITDINLVKNDIIKRAIEYLITFYKTDYPIDHLIVADHLGVVREIFGNISDSKIWITLLSSYKAELMKLTNVTKEISLTSSNIFSEDLSLEVDVFEASTHLFEVFENYISEKHKVENLKELYLTAYNIFSDSIQLRTNLFKIEGNVLKNALSEYIVEKNTISYNRSQIEYMSGEKDRRSICSTSINHDTLLSSTRKLYMETNEVTSQIFLKSSDLTRVQRKIDYNRKMTLYLYNKIHSRQKIRVILGVSTDSLEMSDALCSTKLDLDNSITNFPNRLNTSFLKSSICITVDVQELTFFTEIAPYQILSSISLVLLDSKTRYMKSTETSRILRSFENIMATNHWFLDHMERMLLSAVILNACLSVINKKCTIAGGCIYPDFIQLIKKGRMIKFLDESKNNEIIAKLKIPKIGKYYSALVNNILHDYIHEIKNFNRRSYLDYHSEYITYYSIIQNNAENIRQELKNINNAS